MNMGSFFYPSFYPSRFYRSEPQLYPQDWMPDMVPWHRGYMQPFDQSPYGYRRPIRYPTATRQGRNQGRVWGGPFTQPSLSLRRSRVPVRVPFQQLFDDEFFRSALADDVFCLLDQHSQKLDEAANKTPEGESKTGEKEDSSAAASASSSGNTDPDTKPSTSAAPSRESSSSGGNANKKDAESSEKESDHPNEGYILRFELSPDDGFYRPVYSPVPLTSLRRAPWAVNRLLNDDLFKSVFTDDLLALLEHHVKEADDAYRMNSEPSKTDASSSEGAVARTDAVDNNDDKPFNVSLKLGDFNPENVNVSLDGRKVIVKAKREEQGKDDSWKRHSNVEYSFMLPKEMPAESLKSSFDKDGILSITAEKNDTTKNAVECSKEGMGETECKKEEPK